VDFCFFFLKMYTQFTQCFIPMFTNYLYSKSKKKLDLGFFFWNCFYTVFLHGLHSVFTMKWKKLKIWKSFSSITPQIIIRSWWNFHQQIQNRQISLSTGYGIIRWENPKVEPPQKFPAHQFMEIWYQIYIEHTLGLEYFYERYHCWYLSFLSHGDAEYICLNQWFECIEELFKNTFNICSLWKKKWVQLEFNSWVYVFFFDIFFDFTVEFTRP